MKAPSNRLRAPNPGRAWKRDRVLFCPGQRMPRAGGLDATRPRHKLSGVACGTSQGSRPEVSSDLARLSRPAKTRRSSGVLEGAQEQRLASGAARVRSLGPGGRIMGLSPPLPTHDQVLEHPRRRTDSARRSGSCARAFLQAMVLQQPNATYSHDFLYALRHVRISGRGHGARCEKRHC